jgi:integrase
MGSLPKINFTKRSLEAIETPTAREKRITVYDTQVRGLGFLIRPKPSEHRSYFWYRKVRGQNQWHTIANFDDMSIEQARAKATDYNKELADWKAGGYEGRAPSFEKQPDLTLGSLHDDYCEKHLRAHAKNPDRAISFSKQIFEKHLDPWKNRKLGQVTRQNVRDLHAGIGTSTGKYAANRVVQNLRSVFNWAIDSEIWTGENPATRVQQFHEKKRDRFLQPKEMERLFAALRKEPSRDVVDFILLALMTGARKSDITSMRWDQITFETCSWRIPDPKNKEPYTVALIPEAIQILKRRKNDKKSEKAEDSSTVSPWVFPNPNSAAGHVLDFKRAFRQVIKRAKIEDFRQHDLRRTLGSWQATLGASMPMIKESLGHKSLAATAIYSHVNLDTVRQSVHNATKAMLQVSPKTAVLLVAGKTSRKQLAAAYA